MKKVRAGLLLTLFTLFLAGEVWAAPSPTEQARSTVNRIMDLLNDENMDAESRNRQIEEIIRNRFDFDVMSQWILGIHWRKASPQEREKFKELYTQLLEANYRGRIGEYAEQYTDEQVDFVGERIVDDKALVDTVVVTSTQRIPISYKMVLKGDDWRVYDVVIEEVSLVRNFRSTYDEIIRKEGLQGLFARMEEKIEDLRAGKTTEGDLLPVEKKPDAGAGR